MSFLLLPFALRCWDVGRRPTAPHFSLLRQRKVSKRKATLLFASLRFATGNLRCSVQPGSRSNSPAAQTIAVPDPSGLPLLGADRRDFCSRNRIRIRSQNFPDPDSPVLAGPVNGAQSGIRAARCLSRRRVCADPRFESQAQVARRAPDCGSPFGVRITSRCEVSELPLRDLCLLSFGEAKESEALSGASRQSPQGKASELKAPNREQDN